LVKIFERTDNQAPAMMVLLQPQISRDAMDLVVQMARENPSWGYDRIVGALANVGHEISDQSVGNILRRHGIPPASKRSANTTWKDFIAAHMAVLAGVDFFTVEVLTWRGSVTYYILFSWHLETRRVSLAGMTRQPAQEWMEQVASNAVDEVSGHARHIRYLLHDRDTKFCVSFRKDTVSEVYWALAVAFADRTRDLQLEAFPYAKIYVPGTGTVRNVREIHQSAEFLEYRDLIYSLVHLAVLPATFAIAAARSSGDSARRAKAFLDDYQAAR
jgi:hypothetical protein